MRVVDARHEEPDRASEHEHHAVRLSHRKRRKRNDESKSRGSIRVCLHTHSQSRVAAREIVATGCPIHQAPFGPGEAVECRGPEGVHKIAGLGRAPFSDLAISIEAGSIGDGEMVAARWVAREKMGGSHP